MKKFGIIIFCAGMLISTTACAESVSSPDGSVTASVDIKDGRLCYSVRQNGESVISDSHIGIDFEGSSFTNGVSVVSRRDASIDEVYSMPSGKAEQYINRANEMVLSVTNGEDELELYVRAYDDGAAYRYGYGADTRAVKETADIAFSSASLAAYCAPYEKCYESLYTASELGRLNGNYSMPLTVQTSDDTYAMLFEADLNGSYCGSMITASGTNTLSLTWDEKQNEPVNISAPFLSPWRAVAVGSLDDIVQTQLAENLCPPSEISDDSWIRPGIADWTWFNGDPTNDPAVYKEYIDFAAEMDWQYILLDEGWQPLKSNIDGRKSYEGLSDWTQEVLDYASSKGIGVFVWAPYWDLDTPEKRERLAEWADMGIKGVKIDFFNSETQETLALCDEITEEAARLRLMVNLHGCNKPSGERRTYPNLITREGVYGTEHFLSGAGWGPTAEHNCILPFTRNAVGPMDYTPAISDYNESHFTDAHKAALAVIFESGVQCFSDKPERYRQSPLYDFLKGFPAAWDETRLLSGDAGKSIVMMRRNEDEYYIGSICTAARNEDIRLDFLGTGEYMAEIYTDGEDGIAKKCAIVKNGDIINIKQNENGGAAVRIYPVSESMEFRDIDAHWARNTIVSLAQNNQLDIYFCRYFRPDAKITRAEFVMMLCSAAGIEQGSRITPFSDCAGCYEAGYINAAVSRGIINGISESEFAPDMPVTREQAAVIIGRYLGLSGSAAADFTDEADISGYARDYVGMCAQRGVINGYEDGSFRPRSSITRAESAALMSRISVY